MQASVGSKWKAVAFRHRTGCSTCKSSRQAAFTEREWPPPRNSVECGKSRLVQMLKDHVANEPHTRWECRSVEYTQNTALFPLTDLFQRILRLEAHETPNVTLEKLEQALSQYRFPLEESVPLFAPLLSLPLPEHHYPPLNL